MSDPGWTVVSLKDDSTNHIHHYTESYRSSRSFNSDSTSVYDMRYYSDQMELLDSNTVKELNEWSLNVKDRMLLGCMAILLLMDAVNGTILIPMQLAISNWLRIPISGILWTQTAYLLASAAGNLFFSLGSEILGGHGAPLVLSLLLSIIGTGVGCTASSLTQIITGRLLQGLSGGCVLSLSYVVVAEIVPPCQRPNLSNYAFLVRIVGALAGTLSGGLFVDNLQWNWGFYINFFFCAIGLAMVPLAVAFETSPKFELTRFRSPDWAAGTLVLVGGGSLLIGLSWGGTLHAWESWRTIAPIAAGASGLAALAIYERKWAQNPFFRESLFNNSSSVASYVGSFLQGVLIFVQLQYLTLYLIIVQGISASFAGLSLMGITGVMFATSGVESASLMKSGGFHWTIWAGWMTIIFATGCFILLNDSTPPAAWVLMFVAAGIGHGLLLPGYNICLHSWTTVDNSHHAMKVFSFLRTAGMSLSVPLAASIFLNRLVYEANQAGLPEEVIVNLTQGYYVGGLMKAPLTRTEKEALKTACLLSFRFLWQFMSGVAALGGSTSFFVAKHVLAK